jgi:hypothetical protein
VQAQHVMLENRRLPFKNMVRIKIILNFLKFFKIFFDVLILKKIKKYIILIYF